WTFMVNYRVEDLAGQVRTLRRERSAGALHDALLDGPVDGLQLDRFLRVIVYLDARRPPRLHARGRRHRALEPEAGVVQSELQNRHFISFAWLCFRAASADEVHRLVGNQHDRAASGDGLFPGPTDVERLACDGDGTHDRRFSKRSEES